MPGVISEDYLSRKFKVGLTDSGRELVYHIVGTTDEGEVQTLLAGTAPGSYRGLALDSIEAEPEGNGKWKGYARYLRPDSGDEYTFETTGGTAKITQSRGTTIYPGAYGDAPDFGGAIGVNGDKVEGTDITVPAYGFSETHDFDSATVTSAFKLVLFRMTGKVNNATFKDLAAGECLFLGASGSKRGNDRWKITFRFAGEPNEASLSVGGIGGIVKRGWDYYWVRYDDFADNFAYAIVKRPVAVYVEQVYQFDDFSTLGIGT